MTERLIFADELPAPPERAREYCERLERGAILIAPNFHGSVSAEDRSFLSQIRHNVSYRPEHQELRGFGDDLHRARMRQIMEGYATEAMRFVEQLLPTYAGHLHRRLTAFRAEEEQGRKNAAGKRADLLHINAFPDLPTGGRRILRVFTNLHGLRPRIWDVGDPFELLAGKYAEAAGLRQFCSGDRLVDRMAHTLHVAERSAYDRFMLRFHDWMEESAEFQKNAARERIEFPPGAIWVIFSDGLPHAVLSGQYALEQTILFDFEALVVPDTAPIRILERMCGKKLA